MLTTLILTFKTYIERFNNKLQDFDYLNIYNNKIQQPFMDIDADIADYFLNTMPDNRTKIKITEIFEDICLNGNYMYLRIVDYFILFNYM